MAVVGSLEVVLSLIKEYQKKGERIIPRAPHEIIAINFLENQETTPIGSLEENHQRSHIEPINKKEAVEITERAKTSIRHFQEQGENQFSFLPSETFAVPSQKSQTSLSQELKEKIVTRPSEPQAAIHVFLPNHKAPITTRVKLNTTAEEVIIDVLSKTSTIEALRGINQNHRAYLLRIAEKDGTPDDDIPPLTRNKNVGQFLKISQHYALCKDQSFFKEVWPIDEDPSGTILKIVAPGETSYSSFITKDDTLLKDVKDQACAKRGLRGDDFHLVLSSQPDKPLSLDLKVITLSEKNLRLLDIKRRKDSNPIPFKKKALKLLERPASGSYNAISMVPAYTVTQVGKKRTSLITIDGINDQLIFKSSEHKKEKTKHLKELMGVTTVPGKPTQFQLDFRQKVYRFESQQAEEIVAKIDSLWQCIKDS
ncbi:hypothetical protein PROFUN_08548 [Planoprotostelium fungivorum]|uniref:CRIM domain-containing protein n=1 Tax=Planoprotostelium fungivorum TaxID=1890364 RepID=A0A2P6N1M7_9EUKA|nr:hypothetical protein PROFUN_08548 [Planoprotostelium fungivorum]